MFLYLIEQQENIPVNVQMSKNVFAQNHFLVHLSIACTWLNLIKGSELQLCRAAQCNRNHIYCVIGKLVSSLYACQITAVLHWLKTTHDAVEYLVIELNHTFSIFLSMPNFPSKCWSTLNSCFLLYMHMCCDFVALLVSS